MNATLLALAALSLGAGDPAVREVEKALANLNEAFAKQDAAAIKRLTTADHVAVTGYYGGPQTRAEQLKSLKHHKLTEYAPGKVTVKLLGKDTALVTYPLTLKGTFRGKAVPVRNFASAVWIRREGQWREAFYQETPLGSEKRGGGGNAPRFEIDPQGRVLRRDAAGKVEWTTSLDGGDEPQLLWDAKRVYVRHRGGITALAARTGINLWHVQGQGRLLLHGDQLLTTSETGGARWVISRTVTTGAEVSKLRLPEGVVAGFPLDQDRVFLSELDVVRLSPQGVARWTVAFGDREFAAGGGLVGVGDDLVAFLYCRFADSGVQLVRFEAATGRVAWRAQCAPLGVDHSKYRHNATVTVEGERLRVTSKGTSGTFVETRDLKTGRQLERTVKPN
jgi:ketosteroid isomerase-like protein/outer membrane protein assembly factor BamB